MQHPMALLQQLFCRLKGCLGTASGAKRMARGMHFLFAVRFQRQSNGLQYDAIFHCRDAQHSFFAVGFRDRRRSQAGEAVSAFRDVV